MAIWQKDMFEFQYNMYSTCIDALSYQLTRKTWYYIVTLHKVEHTIPINVLFIYILLQFQMCFELML